MLTLLDPFAPSVTRIRTEGDRRILEVGVPSGAAADEILRRLGAENAIERVERT